MWLRWWHCNSFVSYGWHFSIRINNCLKMVSSESFVSLLRWSRIFLWSGETEDIKSQFYVKSFRVGVCCYNCSYLLAIYYIEYLAFLSFLGPLRFSCLSFCKNLFVYILESFMTKFLSMISYTYGRTKYNAFIMGFGSELFGLS